MSVTTQETTSQQAGEQFFSSILARVAEGQALSAAKQKPLLA